MPYVIFFIAVGFNFFMINRSRGIQKKAFEVVSFVLIALFAGLRASNVGSDTPTYVRYFNMADALDNFGLLALTIEPGYLAWTFLIRKISDSNFAFLMLTSLAQAGLLYKILKNSNNFIFVFVYILLFYLNFHFNTIRVGFAVLFFLCYLTESEKYLKSFFLVIAPLFHVSILFFYPFFALKWSVKSISLALLACMIFVIVFPDVAQMIVDKAASYSEYLDGGGSGVSVLGLVFVLLIVSSLFLHRNSSINFKIIAILLIFIYIAKVKFPVLYRIAFVAQVLYFYYLTSDLSQKFGSFKKWVVLWPIVGALFIVQTHGIFVEKDLLSSRVDEGDLASEALDSGYLPYEMIWNEHLSK